LYNLARMKVLVSIVMMVVVLGYVLYHGDWFQRTYIYPFPYAEIVYDSALEKEVDPFLVAAVIRTESKFNTQARSPKGALGLMQMMPETAKWVAEQMDDPNFDIDHLEKPEVNIPMGIWYLNSLKKEFAGNEILMLAAYNGGRGNVKQWMSKNDWDMSFAEVDKIPFPETRQYVHRVLNSKKRYEELYGR